GPAQADGQVGDGRDGQHGSEDQADRQKQDGPQVGAKIAPGGGDGGRVDQGRHEDQEDDLRVQLQFRQPRDNAEHQLPEDEQNGIGHANFTSQDSQDGHGDEQPENQLDLLHEMAALRQRLCKECKPRAPREPALKRTEATDGTGPLATRFSAVNSFQALSNFSLQQKKRSAPA